MPEKRKTLIMKFGSGALQDSKSFHRIAKLILKKRDRLVIVVSAMRGVTSRLIDLAYAINPTPPQREYDMLVSVGERVSMSLLAMALAGEGIEAVSYTGSQSGVITTNDHTNAQIISVKPYRIIEALEKNKVVIVAGFQGVSEQKEITTLGRGGSDTTAVALGVALNAHLVEFYKDVQGIYSSDPKVKQGGEIFSHLTHQEALAVVEATGGKVIHPAAIGLADKHCLPLHLLPFWGDGTNGTLIGRSHDGRKHQTCMP